jgi:branched-chain amino acid transport system permease protein
MSTVDAPPVEDRVPVQDAEPTRPRWIAVRYPALAVALIALPHVGPFGPYGLYQGSLMMVYGIAVLGLNVSLGFVRLLNVAQAGLMGVGAYATAIALKEEWPYAAAAGAGVVVAAAIGALVGLLAVRVRSHYFLIVTIGVQQALITVFTQWTSVTGGALGMSVASPKVGGLELSDIPTIFTISSVVLVMALYGADRLRDSRAGRAMVGLGQSVPAAHSIGIHAARHNVYAMTVAGGLAGAAGALFAPLVGFVAPESFGLSLSILFIAMVVIGGLGSNVGAVVGVVVLVVIDERLRSRTGTIAGLSYGLLIMALVVVAPGGLANLARRVFGSLKERRSRGVSAPLAEQGARS